MGRHTEYRPEYCEELVKHMAQGYPFETFAVQVGVSRTTLYNWAETFPEFLDALKRGRDESLKWFIDAGRAGMVGKIKDFNPTVWIFMMKNMHKWRDQEKDIVDKLSLASLQGPNQSMNQEQRLAYAKQLRAQLDDFIGAAEPITTRDALGMESETQPGGQTDQLDPIPLASGNTKR